MIEHRGVLAIGRYADRAHGFCPREISELLTAAFTQRSRTHVINREGVARLRQASGKARRRSITKAFGDVTEAHVATSLQRLSPETCGSWQRTRSIFMRWILLP